MCYVAIFPEEIRRRHAESDKPVLQPGDIVFYDTRLAATEPYKNFPGPDSFMYWLLGLYDIKLLNNPPGPVHYFEIL